jgi:phosphatidylinositol-4,5-bisphosphate 3-kinase
MKGLVIDKCKYMESKKLPLWLVFANADRDGPNVYVIFEVGDDLRQDILTLQMTTLMYKQSAEQFAGFGPSHAAACCSCDR